MNQDKKYEFKPVNVSEGDPIAGGDIFGICVENEMMNAHKIMCPPGVSGTVVKVYGAGTDGHEMMSLSDTVLEVQLPNGTIKKLGMSHFW